MTIDATICVHQLADQLATNKIPYRQDYSSEHIELQRCQLDLNDSPLLYAHHWSNFALDILTRASFEASLLLLRRPWKRLALARTVHYIGAMCDVVEVHHVTRSMDDAPE